MIQPLDDRLFITRHDTDSGIRFSIVDKEAGCLLDTWWVTSREEFDSFLDDMEYILGVSDAICKAGEKAAA